MVEEMICSTNLSFGMYPGLSQSAYNALRLHGSEELKQRYLDAGMEPVADELPDHLPLLLEYLSCRDAVEVRDTISEIGHILRVLGNALLQRHSRYASVMTALLALGGEKGLDAQAPVPPAEDLDQAWEERPAFAPPESNPAVTPEHSAP